MATSLRQVFLRGLLSNASILCREHQLTCSTRSLSSSHCWSSRASPIYLQQGTFTNASSLFGTLPIYPELCIFLGTQDTVFETHRGVTEASKLLIPTVGIVDTNCDAEPVTFPVPGNDDSPASMHFYMGLFKTIILRAKEKRKLDGIE
ncbi:30S ribosomal protein s2 [Plakobranchus ocellatus]|uniref:30S ribosomal protein s2 n=1 Tax=Plakobranchus ocellatus TaxID=259542 RepID=A0AAV4DNV1_9GAST|nr:30S ribosomal protein s2 [Plakobranchus ocellatus]